MSDAPGSFGGSSDSVRCYAPGPKGLVGLRNPDFQFYAVTSEQGPDLIPGKIKELSIQ